MMTARLARRTLHDAHLRAQRVSPVAAAGAVDAGVAATFAARCEATADPVRVLYTDLVDVFAALATLHALDAAAEAAVELELCSEANPAALARAAVHLVLVSRGQDDAATATWCDSFLTAEAHGQVHAAIESILEDLEDWLVCDDEGVRAALEGWRDLDLSVEEAAKGRAAVLDKTPDAAETAAWRATQGVASTAGLRGATKKPNELLWDADRFLAKPLFAETNGPQGAFRELRGLEAGTAAFGARLDSLVAPLHAAARSLLERGQLRVLCSSRLDDPKGRGAKYDVVDAGLAVEQAGLWNVLLTRTALLATTTECGHGTAEACGHPQRSSPAPPLEPTPAYVQTVHRCSTLDDVYGGEMPFDAWGHGELLKHCGLRVLDATTIQGDEDDRPLLVVRWALRTRARGLLKPFEPVHSRRRRQFGLLLSECVERCLPMPMSAAMLDETEAVATYVWPKSTMATVVEVALRAARCSRAAIGGLDALLACAALRDAPYARNHALSLLIEASMRKTRLGRAAYKFRFQRRSYAQVRWVKARLLAAGGKEKKNKAPSEEEEEEEEDPLFGGGANRGGVFEPALAVVLVHEDYLLDVVERASQWEDGDGVEVNLLHEWLATEAPYAAVQILDDVRLDLDRRILSIPLPIKKSRHAPPQGEHQPAHDFFPILAHFHHAILVNVHNFEPLADPLPLDAFF